MSVTALPEPDEEELAHSERLRELIDAEIEARGPMPFARFMECCLYAPGLGYYSAGRHKFGPAGDFVTAPELGQVFGLCLARALAPTLTALGAAADLLELGGGSGALAHTLLTALDRAGCAPHRYLMLEPSADLRERQRQRLAASLPDHLFARLAWLDRPPQDAWQGVLLANEVIDALPTTRFTVRGDAVFEEHVTADGNGGFRGEDRPADALVTSAVRHVESDLGAAFADGYRSEILPQLPYWIEAVAGSLERGALWFIDYGHARREFYHRQRSDGTLRAYYRHRAHDDVLRWPGLQDITASVDFTALAEAGNHAGFAVAAWLTQAQFLVASGLAEVHAELLDGDDAAATYTLSQEIKRLTLPGQMGEHFKVMALVRDLPPEALPATVLAGSQAQRL